MRSDLPGPVVVLGGTGNFGKRIVHGLVRHGVPTVIAGRDLAKAKAFARTLPDFRGGLARLDIHDPAFGGQLAALSPSVVVNTCGPFQRADYGVARVCIAQKIHYIDLADGRDFVTGITTLDESAKIANVCVISGASTVPGLSSAVIEHFRGDFRELESVAMGISPGQKAERGLATTEAIMTYVGKPLRPFAGATRPVYGWQDIFRQEFSRDRKAVDGQLRRSRSRSHPAVLWRAVDPLFRRSRTRRSASGIVATVLGRAIGPFTRSAAPRKASVEGEQSVQCLRDVRRGHVRDAPWKGQSR